MYTQALKNRIIAPAIKLRNPWNLNWIWLKFSDAALEKRYRVDYAGRSLLIVRIAMLLGGAQYVLFTLLDMMLGNRIRPEDFLDLSIIRIAVFLFILTIIGWSFQRSFKRYFQPALSLVPLAAGIGNALMILMVANEGGFHQSYVGFILIFIYVHVLLRLRFVYATVVSWIIFFMFLYASLQIQVSYFSLISSTFFLLSTQFCGMVASYLLEYYDRTVFRQKLSLDQKRRQLKEQVDQKTDELNEMRAIQLTLLPEKPPSYPEFEIASTIKTASEVGGDYYDFHLGVDGTLTMVIADATGHGAKAGLMVTAAKILFMLFGRRKNIPETLGNFSKIIKSTGIRQLYLSMALIRLKNNHLELSGAGIPPALHWSATNGTITEIPLKGMPLGSVTTYPYISTSATMAEGDLLFLMTDGLPELRDRLGNMLGYETPKKLLEKYVQLNPDQVLKAFEEEISNFSNGTTLADDITLIVLKKRQG